MPQFSQLYNGHIDSIYLPGAVRIGGKARRTVWCILSPHWMRATIIRSPPKWRLLGSRLWDLQAGSLLWGVLCIHLWGTVGRQMGREPWHRNSKGLSQSYKSSGAGWPCGAAPNQGYIPSLHSPHSLVSHGVPADLGKGVLGKEALFRWRQIPESLNRAWVATSTLTSGGAKGFQPKGGGRGSFRRTLQHSSYFLPYSHQWQPLRLALGFKSYATFSSFVTGCHLVSKTW